MRYTRPRLVVLVIAAITSSGQAQIKETWMHGDDFYDRLYTVTDPAQADELLGEWFTKRTAGVLYLDVPFQTKESWRKGFFAVPTKPYAHYVTGAKASTKQDFIGKLQSLEQAEIKLLMSPSPAAGSKYQKLLGAFATTYGRQSSTVEFGADNPVFSFRKRNYEHVYDELIEGEDALKSTSLLEGWLADRSAMLFFAQSAPEISQTWKTTFNPAKSKTLTKVLRETPPLFHRQLVAEMHALVDIEDRLRANNSVEAKISYYVTLGNFADDWAMRSSAVWARSGIVFSVAVQTVDRNSRATVNGHYVFFVPRLLSCDPAKFKQFCKRYNRRSPTETRRLLAGPYFFWSQHDAKTPDKLPDEHTTINVEQDATEDPVDVPEPRS